MKGAQPQGTQAGGREGPGVAARFNKEPKPQAAHRDEAGWRQVWGPGSTQAPLSRAQSQGKAMIELETNATTDLCKKGANFWG